MARDEKKNAFIPPVGLQDVPDHALGGSYLVDLTRDINSGNNIKTVIATRNEAKQTLALEYH